MHLLVLEEVRILALQVLDTFLDVFWLVLQAHFFHYMRHIGRIPGHNVVSHHARVVDVREFGRHLHGLAEQAFLLLFGKLLLINNKRLVLGINVAVLVFTVRFVGQHFLWLPLVRVLLIFEAVSQMLVVVLRCHRAIPHLQSLSIKIIVIAGNLPLYILQKLLIFLQTVTFIVSAGKLFELGTMMLLVEQLILLIHLP